LCTSPPPPKGFVKIVSPVPLPTAELRDPAAVLKRTAVRFDIGEREVGFLGVHWRRSYASLAFLLTGRPAVASPDHPCPAPTGARRPGNQAVRTCIPSPPKVIPGTAASAGYVAITLVDPSQTRNPVGGVATGHWPRNPMGSRLWSPHLAEATRQRKLGPRRRIQTGSASGWESPPAKSGPFRD